MSSAFRRFRPRDAPRSGPPASALPATTRPASPSTGDDDVASTALADSPTRPQRWCCAATSRCCGAAPMAIDAAVQAGRGGRLRLGARARPVPRPRRRRPVLRRPARRAARPKRPGRRRPRGDRPALARHAGPAARRPRWARWRRRRACSPGTSGTASAPIAGSRPRAGRRLPARLPRLRRAAFPAHRPGRDHAGGARRPLPARPQARFAPGMYSCLAGFIEPGETHRGRGPPRAVRGSRRRDRTGRYLACQPWPFPSSLMIGCFARGARRRYHVRRQRARGLPLV